MGAIIIPFIGYKYAKKIYDYPKKSIEDFIPTKYKIKIFILALALFIFLEILWRMMFEFLIAFLQMRDALVA
jgi:hypothetical protein